MTNHAPNRPLALSQRLYQHLLVAYPRRHRDEYGRAMAQLFRDQCRDAWDEDQSRGLAALWLHTLPDLVKTSFIERWSSFNPGKYMTDKLNNLLPSRPSPSSIFLAVFIFVFLLVFTVATAITFILPETYASTARIKVESDQAANQISPGSPPGYDQPYDPYFIQTTFEVIQSQLVLSNVVASLNLDVSWGKKYYAGRRLTNSETIELLKRRLDLKPISNTKLISITVYSDDRKEAPQIANAIARSYQEYRAQTRKRLEETGLASLQTNFQSQESQIEQLQAEKDALARQFGIRENWTELQKTYQTQLADSQKSTQALQSQFAALQGLDPLKLREVLPTVTADPALSELMGKLSESDQQLAALKVDYAPTDVHVSRIVSTRNEINQQIDARVAGIMAALKSELTSRQEALASLQATIDNGLKNSKPTPENQSYWDKKHDLEQLLGFHQAIRAKIETLKVDMSIPRADLVQIVDSATPAEAPVKPNKPLNLAIGAVAGVFFGTVTGSLAALIVARKGKPVAVPKPA